MCVCVLMHGHPPLESVRTAREMIARAIDRTPRARVARGGRTTVGVGKRARGRYAKPSPSPFPLPTSPIAVLGHHTHTPLILEPIVVSLVHSFPPPPTNPPTAPPSSVPMYPSHFLYTIPFGVVLSQFVYFVCFFLVRLSDGYMDTPNIHWTWTAHRG